MSTQDIFALGVALVFTLVALCSMVAPVKAAEVCGETMSHQQFVSQMITTIPNLNVVTMDKNQHKSYVSALNALPPKTSYAPHKVYIYQAPQHYIMLVEMVDIHGCMMSIEKIKPTVLFKMMGIGNIGQPV